MKYFWILLFFFVCSLDLQAQEFCIQKLQSERHLEFQIKASGQFELLNAPKNKWTKSFRRQPSNHLGNIEEAFERIEKHLNKKIEIHYLDFYFFDQSEFLNYSNYMAVYCTNLFSKNRFVLFLNRGFFEASENIFSFLSHEYFHWLVDKYGLELPHWLEEGAAQLFEANVLGKHSKDMQQFHLNHSPGLPLELDVTHVMGDRDLIQSYYGNALLFLEYLAGRRPKDFLNEFFVEVNAKDYKKIVLRAFERANRRTSPSFEELYHYYSKAKYFNLYDYSEGDEFLARKFYLGKFYSPAKAKPSAACFSSEEGASVCFTSKYSSSLVPSARTPADISFQNLPRGHINYGLDSMGFYKSQ